MLRRVVLTRATSLQHASDAQVFVNVRPVNAHWHDLEMSALAGGSLPQPWVPLERRCDPATIGQSYNQLCRGELDRTGLQVTDVNFQSAHSKRSAVDRDSASDDG